MNRLLQFVNHLIRFRVRKNRYFRAVVQEWGRTPRGPWAWSVDRFLETCGSFWCHHCGTNRIGVPAIGRCFPVCSDCYLELQQKQAAPPRRIGRAEW